MTEGVTTIDRVRDLTLSYVDLRCVPETSCASTSPEDRDSRRLPQPRPAPWNRDDTRCTSATGGRSTSHTPTPGGSTSTARNFSGITGPTRVTKLPSTLENERTSDVLLSLPLRGTYTRAHIHASPRDKFIVDFYTKEAQTVCDSGCPMSQGLRTFSDLFDPSTPSVTEPYPPTQLDCKFT